MYDEFDDRDVRDTQSVNGGPEPDETGFSGPEAEDEEEARYFDDNEDAFSEDGQQGADVYASSESSRQEEPEISHAGVVQRQQEENSGFYHYAYNNDGRQDADQEPQQEGQTAHKAQKNKNGRPLWKSFAICAGMAVVFGVVASAAFQVTGYVGSKAVPRETEMTVGTADTVMQSEAQEELKTTSTEAAATTAATNITQVAENAMPSIVAITNIGVEEVQSMFFGRSYQQQTESAGSGVIVSQNDTELLIATNNHVVAGAEELSVCFTVDVENDEDAVVSAQIKGTDAEHDLAIVAVNLADIPDDVKSQIKVIQIGTSSSLAMGQQVIAIGNALGYGQSLTVGYVSALDREVTVENEDGSGTITNNMIQTDAAINAGNSGGALLNTAGELVGINSVKAVSTGVEGMGYAIPIDTAKPILDELMNRETRTVVDTSEMGYMGVTPRDVSEEAREVYNMPAGAFIYEVQADSPAEAAGIKKGDIITKFDGRTISSSDDLFDTMNYYKAGETVEVIVSTAEGGDYVERTVSVTLGERPADTTTTQQSGGEGQSGEGSQDGYGDGYGSDGYYSDDYMNPFEQFFNNY